MIELLPNIFAQPLHPSEYRGEIINGKLYLYHKAQLSDDVRSIVDLPPGSYEILFTTKGVSEQDAKRVVEKYYNGGAAIYPFYFRDYEKKDIEFSYGTATESLQSLLKSKGLTAGNYLIIKKVEG